MIEVRLSKARADYFVACFELNLPIEPPPDGWTSDELLALAGAAIAMDRSARSAVDLAVPDESSPEPSEEEWRNYRETKRDVLSAVEFYGDLFDWAILRHWHLRFEEDVHCRVRGEIFTKVIVEQFNGEKPGGGRA